MATPIKERKVHYISSEKHIALCDLHPKVPGRASTVNELLNAYGLIEKMNVVCPKLCSEADLLSFHTNDFVECIASLEEYFDDKVDVSENLDYSEIMEELDVDICSHGFGYDCEIFKNLPNYIKSVAGATITAADVLMTSSGMTDDVAFSLNGGWHHAHIDEVAGFCYVNDIVIGILHLMKKFKKILYIDFDIHHGDGVEEAFKYSNKVVTFSLHKFSDGFFPGTGSYEDNGCGSGKFHTINVPLKNGIRDATYGKIFTAIFDKLFDAVCPEVIVCQCGADMLTGDPLGGFNLTEKCILECMKLVLSKRKPTLVLGGGGYNIPNTARCWTRLVADVLDIEVDDNIPEHDLFEVYGPDFRLGISPSNRKDENDPKYVTSTINEVSSLIEKLALSSQPLKTAVNANVLDKENKTLLNDEITCKNESFDVVEPPSNKRQILQEDYEFST